ncbi:MAG: succinylglutamate desuccinylase/aspartoacylase family protein [Saprospiraceae bacterium]|nr:succinylglutamate desuccinylase/aspartoacylase family protein [Saprospiraceae bacterium]MBP7699730.1 succinylglutamate desuccinylase/aspartoacylase family protein [Saprospiraceae bacterium]
MERIIGEFTGNEHGALVFCFGGMHGNEKAGVKALDLVFKMLEVEPITNPSFTFKGRLVGLLANKKAYNLQKRFMVKDLNRQWKIEHITTIQTLPYEQLDAEDSELLALLAVIKNEIATYQPTQLYFLDLHTTSAQGGIFSIVADDLPSLKLATALHAPVVTGLLNGIEGTTLHYFNTENLGLPTSTVSFEAGQHDEPFSINRSIAAIIHFLRATKCIRDEDVENRHDEVLINYASGLPKVVRLVNVHRIAPDDNFVMQPNYKNFQPIKKGEWLASDRHGKIVANEDGMILMPLYQPQGSDGFFVVQEAVIS